MSMILYDIRIQSVIEISDNCQREREYVYKLQHYTLSEYPSYFNRLILKVIQLS